MEPPRLPSWRQMVGTLEFCRFSSLRHEPVALLPTEEYEINGCYSGSAVLNDGKITLIYTGNVKYADGSRTAYQCLASESSDGSYQKLGPVISLPEGYTGHVRDPKVWQHDVLWYMCYCPVTGNQRQGTFLPF